MLKLIQDFPNHIIEGIEIANQTNFTNTKNNIRNVILCGMGGSGIGAKIVSDWVRSEANVPVTLVSDYFLPDFVSEVSFSHEVCSLSTRCLAQRRAYGTGRKKHTQSRS